MGSRIANRSAVMVKRSDRVFTSPSKPWPGGNSLELEDADLTAQNQNEVCP